MPQHCAVAAPRRLPAWKFVAWCCVCFFVAVGPVSACLWDYDTLQSERLRFPTTLELMSGKFLRHSPEYYHWRLKDRQRRLTLPENKNDPELLDDLAVAHHKLGDNKEAIRLTLESNARQPNRYETLANLGTFYMLDGQFEIGRDYIVKALEINPDAHFGRERYQKLLADYVIQRKVNGKIKLPLCVDHDPKKDKRRAEYNFADFVLNAKQLGGFGSEENRESWRTRQREELQTAITGVLGMMKFADYQSPVLLEVLGDLLHGGQESRQGIDFDARNLAGRAYLLAAKYSKDEDAKTKYLERLSGNMGFQHRPDEKNDWAPVLTAELETECAEADQWYAAVRQNEMEWINSGADVDAEFTEHYYQDPEVLLGKPYGPAKTKQIESQRLKLIGIGTIVAMCLTSIGWYFTHRKTS
jgi:tetratricopeptide (TPR) repeat protein